MAICPVCNKRLKNSLSKYCSNSCQSLDRYHRFIKEWKNGFQSGGRGINAKNISGHVRRYLTEKYGEKCSECGWRKKNPVTDKVPLEVDHIDGNSDNNLEHNLRLICPNCHSLSSNFRNLNRGKGRSWRRIKYMSN